MGVQTITYASAKTMTLKYLQDIINKQFPQQRTSPTINFADQAWSTTQLYAQVQNNTDVGRRFVNFYISSLNTSARRTGGPQYIISG